MSLKSMMKKKCRGGKMAEGGFVYSGKQRVYNERGVHKNMLPEPDNSGTSLAGELVRAGERVRPDGRTNMDVAKDKHKRRLAELKAMPDPKLMAEGGEIHSRTKREDWERGVNKPGFAKGESQAGEHTREGAYDVAKGMHKQSLQEQTDIKGPTSGKSGFAEGGMADCPDCCDGMPCELHGEQSDAHEMDMVSQVMNKRKMSKGGMVANSDEIKAGFMPNEFDDLHLRDGLESSYTGTNSGDEAEDPENDSRLQDMVSRVMLKRKKQTNPRPA